MRVTRRTVVAGVASAGAVGSMWGRNVLALAPAAGFVKGATRELPARICGFNTPVMWDIPFEDPAMRPILAGTHPALLRFPGGTIANYWNWKTGRVEVAPEMMGSFATGARNAPTVHPLGATYEDFVIFARAVGSEVVLVLNLETATLENQMAWLRHLVDVGAAPALIELGNEFYLELAFAQLASRSARIASQSAALALGERYAAAARKIVPNAKIAVQSAGSAYDAAAGTKSSPLQSSFVEWDAGLTAAPWYDAVTWHIYPEISHLLGDSTLDPSLVSGVRSAAPERFRSAAYLDERDAELAFAALLARIESGTRRHAQFLARTVPGKEVWVTEWGTGENRAYYRGERPRVTGLWIHALARQLMCLLREPGVTIALNHSIYLDGLAWSCFHRDGSESVYAPHGAYDVFAWLHEAANAGKNGGGVRLTEYAIDDARTVKGGGAAEESYTDLMGLLFEHGTRRTLIVHNTRATAAVLDLSGTGMGGVRAEALETPSIRETYSTRRPAVRTLAVSGSTLVAPARSLVRVRQSA
jgi:hypothetical protein